MDGIDPRWQAYAEQFSSPESELLHRIRRETHLQVLKPRMLAGHFQGRVLAMISHMIRPARVLEIGTYTGYSALCLAEGLQPEGKLITVDVNPELEARVRAYFRESHFAHQLDFRMGDARTVVPTLTDMFDLIYLDADKAAYKWYYETVFPKLRVGGCILVDNVMWSGKVVDQSGDKDTRLMKEFNEHVAADPRVAQVLLPIRDGLFLIRKCKA